MKITQNKVFLPIMGLIIGIAIVLAGNICAVDLRGWAPAFLAVGGGIFGLSMSKLVYILLKKTTARKHPELLRAQTIELKDERNNTIRDKAGAKTNSLILDLIFILTFVFAFMSVELFVTAMMGGLMLINVVAYTLYTKYYNKRL